MSYTGPNGSTRHCNARCYNSTKIKSIDCLCICGGKNHGVGESQATINTRNRRDDVHWRETHRGIIFSDLQMDLITADSEAEKFTP
jgi:hypothetical protein